MDKLDTFAQTGSIFHYGSLRDTERSILGSAFHKSRIALPTRHHDAVTTAVDAEVGRGYTVIGEQLLREHLVPRNHHAARITPRVRLPQQLEHADHVVIIGDDTAEFFKQVEDNIGRHSLHRFAQPSYTVAHADEFNLVTQAAQCFPNVVFDSEGIHLLHAHSRNGFGRNKRLVGGDKDFVRLHAEHQLYRDATTSAHHGIVRIKNALGSSDFAGQLPQRLVQQAICQTGDCRLFRHCGHPTRWQCGCTMKCTEQLSSDGAIRIRFTAEIHSPQHARPE